MRFETGKPRLTEFRGGQYATCRVERKVPCEVDKLGLIVGVDRKTHPPSLLISEILLLSLGFSLEAGMAAMAGIGDMDAWS